ncbi:MAG: (d)CMP kinase, partial [Propionibacteriaceae bacterium]
MSEAAMSDEYQAARQPSRTTESNKPLVIAIDGPSGSGKSSTARGVAERLGLAFLDTGAMYRAITWLALQEGLDLDDQAAVARLLSHASIEIDQDPRRPAIAINGVDVSEAIRAPEVSAAVSIVAANLKIRADLVARQKKLIAGAGDGIVAEGRDITTVVAPDAGVRVLL